MDGKFCNPIDDKLTIHKSHADNHLVNTFDT